MKINIVNGYGLGDVIKMNSILGTNEFPKLNNPTNEFDINGINVLSCDYTPIRCGDIFIKYPDKTWEKLRTNSKIVKNILSKIDFVVPHCCRKSNILASIKRSQIKEIMLWNT